MSSNSFSYEKNPRLKQVHYANIDEDDESDEPGFYKRSPKKNDQYGPGSPVKSELQVKESSDNSDLVTLVHTVSFYRRQQQTTSSSVSNTPIRKVTRGNDGHEQRKLDFDDDSDMDSSDADRRVENKIAVQERVRKLLSEVEKQQTIISQTSQALNLCAATIEFSGSTESVEAERLLLIASECF
jgi:actin-binding protein anillin